MFCAGPDWSSRQWHILQPYSSAKRYPQSRAPVYSKIAAIKVFIIVSVNVILVCASIIFFPFFVRYPARWLTLINSVSPKRRKTKAKVVNEYPSKRLMKNVSRCRRDEKEKVHMANTFMKVILLDIYVVNLLPAYCNMLYTLSLSCFRQLNSSKKSPEGCRFMS
jgi:hypothetical protein